jgi:hypothetical protein
MSQIIIAQVIETFNNSGNRAAKQVFKLLVRIHDVDKDTVKALTLRLHSYI